MRSVKTDSGKILRLSLLLLGGAALMAGIVRGEAGEIYSKSIRICLECIGVG